MAKPDNRADNVEHLQQHVQNTEQNLHEAEQYLDEHADEISTTELNDIQVKNEHRKESLQKFRAEIQDEANQ
ncbi:small acid-soluble spore protein Tlp [Paenibacillus aurantiacus]|uniref:Small acid-soluble spore protein Tlp n=1 Tax=Paenibacillus aurantiacus TaxID=1936118 RepID=A0ABV5L182_9BACL